MKKIYIAIAVLAAAALTSCQQEQSFEDHIFGENEITFVLQGNETRAAEVGNPVVKGETIKLGEIGDLNLFLEETITDLNGILPETKGSPIYTENVGSFYKDKLVVKIPGMDDTVYESMDDKLTYDHVKNDSSKGKGWRYHHNYTSSIWPTNGTAVEFYLRMPDDMTSYGVTMKTTAEGKTTFDYTSPTTAAAQQDIIFSYASMTESQHKAALPNGYPVEFYHALSGVKFAISNELVEGKLEMGIKVTGVTFIGLSNTGTCTVNLAATNNKVSWEDVEPTSDTNTISQTFDPATENVVTYKQDLFPENFFTTGTTTGANQSVTGSEINKKDDASYTFWLIPQNFTNSNAVIRIDYEINGVTEYMELPLKSIAKKAWDAGQLRTFTFKLNDVNLKIEDTVTSAGTAANGFTGSKKSAVTITNTGNTDAFIRAAIVGQWLSSAKTDDTEAGDIVFGFTDAVGNVYDVESWYQDQFVNGSHNHGEFVGLAGYKDTSEADGANNAGSNPFNDWVLCKDGYYYYTKAVAPNGTTAKLFDSYTLKTAPKPTYGGTTWSAQMIYFTLEIATQAVSANKLDGSQYAWADAWAIALGETNKPVKK